MKKIFILSITLLLAVLAMAACTAGAAPTNTIPAVPVTPLAIPTSTLASVSAEPASAELTDALLPVPPVNGAPMQRIYGKDDTNIVAGAGQIFLIQLDENPTTGYEWADAVISDESVVQQTNTAYEATPAASGIVGSGGARTITFQALKAGTTTITLNYERSWEKKPAETLVYNVTVN